MRRIVLVAMLIVTGCAAAAAQSSTATSGTIKPMTTAPVSGDALPNGQPKAKIPPAARSGESGLRVGESAVTGEPVEIKRKK